MQKDIETEVYTASILNPIDPQSCFAAGCEASADDFWLLRSCLLGIHAGVGSLGLISQG